MPAPRFLILADGDFGPMTSKTANSVIRYLPERTFDPRDMLANTIGAAIGAAIALLALRSWFRPTGPVWRERTRCS